jgi:hypothetical protein
LILFFPVFWQKECLVDNPIFVVSIRLELKKDGYDLETEIEEVTLGFKCNLQEIEDCLLEGHFVLAIGLNIVEGKHPNGLE